MNRLTEIAPYATCVAWAPETDFQFSYNGSICLLRPLTDAADEWLEEHTPPDAEHQYHGNALAIECRYVESIIRGLTDDGLTVELA